VDPNIAKKILLNEMNGLKEYDERTLIKATRIWFSYSIRQRCGR